MRKLSDMSETERQAYNIWRSRLHNDMSTPEEKQEARRQMDALEWSGTTGPVMKALSALELRVSALEAGGGKKSSAKLSKKAETDLLAFVIEEAKTALYAEANAAAVEEVGKLMGDINE